MLLKKISPHLQQLSTQSKAVKKQFYKSQQENTHSKQAFVDPLLEDSHKPVKGLVHKYKSRVLIELTMDCAAYCRFCTRRREVSDIEKGLINTSEVDQMFRYLKKHPEVNELVFSGGDPLMVNDLLIMALNKLSKLKTVKIIRVHTRVPVSNPSLLKQNLLDTLTRLNQHKTLYLSVHFEHPDEFTAPTIKAVQKLKKTGAILLSQSVFLKGVNDNYDTLYQLFSRLAELGIRPYYIYHCDLVCGVEHFIVPIQKEVTIMTKLRKNLSGIAFPIHVVDTPNGAGKIPVPLGFWHFDSSSFTDFKDKKIQMY